MENVRVIIGPKVAKDKKLSHKIIKEKINYDKFKKLIDNDWELSHESRAISSLSADEKIELAKRKGIADPIISSYVAYDAGAPDFDHWITELDESNKIILAESAGYYPYCGYYEDIVERASVMKEVN